MSTLICLTHVSREDVTKQWLSFFFGTDTYLENCLHTKLCRNNRRGALSRRWNFSLMQSVQQCLAWVPLRTFSPEIAKRRLAIWTWRWGKQFGPRAYEIQPLLSGSHVAGTGSDRLGGCHCACELLFLKHQAALWPQALRLLWNPSCMKPIRQIPGHTQETAPPSSPSRALLWLLFRC